MKIKVEIKNEIFGDSIFWEGYSKYIYQIPNVVAKKLAESVAKDGKTRKMGMWIVSEIKG